MKTLKIITLASLTLATLTSPVISHAKESSLLVEAYPYYHELPESISKVCSEQDNCPEIDISYIISSKEWVNKIINQQINDLIASDVPYQPITKVDYALKVPTKVTKTLNDFAELQLEEQIPMRFEKTIEPTYLGHTGSLELFAISGYDYLGGAHGLGYSFFSILDNDSKKELTLDDLLTRGAKSKLTKLVEAEFDNWLITIDEDPKSHKQSWEFKLTDNVTFGKDGLVFLYQPYEVTPYAYGMPEITVSYDKLHGIIKTKYLKAGKQLR